MLGGALLGSMPKITKLGIVEELDGSTIAHMAGLCKGPQGAI